jgi:3-oxoacyl-[acyl-carrier protein] reductase
MSDRYSQVVNLPVAGGLAKRIGLPTPVQLDRYRPGEPLIKGRVLLAGAGRVAGAAARVLAEADVDSATALDDPVRTVVAGAGLDAAVFNPLAPAEQRFKALVFDATGIASAKALVELQRFFYPTVSRVRASGRVVVLGTPPADCGEVAEATAQRALEGFTRSLAKEIGKGSTVQLVYVEPGAEDQIDSTLRFLLSPRSAYVSAQVIHVTKTDRHPAGVDWERPLAGRTALVTGASRGIGASIAETLERDGATVIRLDMPGTGADIELDITADDAPAVIAERCAEGLDVLVHNAGITKDRTLAKMPEERWQQVLDVNLIAQERIDEVAVGLLREDGRIVCVSSMSGIAGNAGQTNYATSKAGVIGMVQALAPALERGITINAVAPGFIETQMTAAMPIPVREAGRRMNSMRQGGLPVDVAETIAWFASPASAGLNGNVVRVCGQSLIGA